MPTALHRGGTPAELDIGQCLDQRSIRARMLTELRVAMLCAAESMLYDVAKAVTL
jgi:hypothetical protein